MEFAGGSFFFIFRASDHFNHAPDKNHGGKHHKKSDNRIDNIFFYIADQLRCLSGVSDFGCEKFFNHKACSKFQDLKEGRAGWRRRKYKVKH